MPPADEPEETCSVEDAVKVLYLRVALVAQRIGSQHPSYFHLFKAGQRLERAYRCAVADRAGRN